MVLFQVGFLQEGNVLWWEEGHAVGRHAGWGQTRTCSKLSKHLKTKHFSLRFSGLSEELLWGFRPLGPRGCLPRLKRLRSSPWKNWRLWESPRGSSRRHWLVQRIYTPWQDMTRLKVITVRWIFALNNPMQCRWPCHNQTIWNEYPTFDAAKL